MSSSSSSRDDAVERRKVGRRVDGAVLLIVTTCAFVIGLGVFTKGFFLTRFEIDLRSRCDRIPNGDVAKIPRFDEERVSEERERESTCWDVPKRFDKMVFLLVDGLRYDFVASLPDDERPSYFHARMPSLRRLAKDRPRHALLYRFVADPPTVTMQRLKGILTGGLPTFIDIRKNFASTELTEDNLVAQLRASGKRMVFMGDDTWTKLFPSSFDRQYPFPSFDVKDLDTVDLGVIDHLVDEMEREDWDVIVAHTLGVDHVGHRFGPNHPEMGAKLERTDHLIADVVDRMDNSTLLVVFGDHGMTSDGNHGGATPDETGAALFMYSKSIPVHDGADNGEREVSQVDLVPTLSMLLGVPIPFGSLGSLLPELYYGNHAGADDAVFKRALRLNAAQVWTYLNTYATVAGTFSARSMDRLSETLEDGHNDDVSGAPSSMRSSLWTNDAAVRRDYTFLRRALDMCRAQWTAFDWTSIALGLLIMSVSTATFALDPMDRIRSIVLGTVVQDRYNEKSHTTSMRTRVWRMSRFETIVPALLLTGMCVSFTSNSYVEAAADTMVFLTSSSVVVVLLVALRDVGSRDRSVQKIGSCALATLSCVRLSLWYVRMRREEGPLGCSERVSFAYSLVPMLMIWLLFNVWYERRRDGRASLSSCARFRRVASAVCFAMTWFHWIAESRVTANDDSSSEQIAMTLANAAVVLSGVAIFSSRVLRVHDPDEERTLALLCCVPVVLLSLGPRSPLSVLLLVLAAVSFLELCVEWSKRRAACRSSSTFCATLVWCLLGYHGYFATGHTSEFASLQHSCGFVGLRSFHPVLSPMWVFLNTVASPCGMAASVPLLSSVLRESKATTRSVQLSVALSSACMAFSTAATAALHNRHLMVWAIFAPKFVAESALAVCVFASLAIGRVVY